MLIVNPNLTVDRTIALDVLAPGTVVRTASAVVTLGGKGVNVARVGRALGHQAPVLGFLPAQSAEQLRALATEEGADVDGVTVAGTVRAASVLLERSGRVTVLNEPGSSVDAGAWERLLSEIERRVAGEETVVCSGSLPPGSPVDAYGRVVAMARRLGVRCVVDATGEVLAAALAERPDVVSPNLAEAESLVLGVLVEDVEPSGGDLEQRATEAAGGLVARGAAHAIVSAGSRGAAFSRGDRPGFCRAPKVTVVNPIGAGDALLGGVVHALEFGEDWPYAVEFGVAVASASCEQTLAGGVDLDRLVELAVDRVPRRSQM